MKKLISYLLLSMLLVGINQTLHAQNSTRQQAALLLEDGKMKLLTPDLLGKLSKQDKNDLYQLYSKNDITVPILLNISLGFGFGSYVQDDIGNGVLLTITSLLSVSAFVSFIVLVNNSPVNSGDPNASAAPVASAVSWIGISLFNFVYGITAPIMYQKNYNKKLKRLLFVDNFNFHIEELRIAQGNNNSGRGDILDPVYFLTYNYRL